VCVCVCMRVCVCVCVCIRCVCVQQTVPRGPSFQHCQHSLFTSHTHTAATMERGWRKSSIRPTLHTTGDSGFAIKRFSVLHVEYAIRRINDGIIFTSSLFYKYSSLESVRVPIQCRVHQAEYVIHILVAVSQVYVNTFSTCRFSVHD